MPGFGLGGTANDTITGAGATGLPGVLPEGSLLTQNAATGLGGTLPGQAVLGTTPVLDTITAKGLAGVKNFVAGQNQGSGFINSAGNYESAGSSVGTSNGVIKQTERLFTVRPRSVANGVADQVQNLTSSNSRSTYVTNRGTISRIRLLTNNPNRSTSFDTAVDLSVSSLPEDVRAMQSDAGYTKFLLTDVQVGYSEKLQVTETFGDAEVAYYFGKSPVIFTLSGLLFDDIDNDWFTKFQRLYSSVMRGTELARNNELIQVILPNMEIIGSVMNMSYSQNSQRDTDIPFSFQVLAKVVTPRVMVVPAAGLSDAAAFIDFGRSDNFTGFTNQSQINSLKNKVASAKSAIQNPLASASLISGIMSKLTFSLGDVIGAGNGGDSTAAQRQNGAQLPTLGGTFSTDVNGVSTTLTGFRASIFSPVYGILSSITKVVKATTGDISAIISQFTNPVNTVLKDIRNVSAEAINVVNTIENSINNVINIPLQTIKQVQQTIQTLKNTAGVISRVPETISDILKRLTKSGHINPTGAFLSGSSGSKNKTALLNSGQGYTAKRGAFL